MLEKKHSASGLTYTLRALPPPKELPLLFVISGRIQLLSAPHPLPPQMWGKEQAHTHTGSCNLFCHSLSLCS